MRNPMLHAHIGLASTPLVSPRACTTAEYKVVKLPYMGPHKHDDTVGKPYLTDEYRLKAYQEKEAGSEAARPPEFTDPCELLMRKIATLSRLLDCSEADAEALLFDRL